MFPDPSIRNGATWKSGSRRHHLRYPTQQAASSTVTSTQQRRSILQQDAADEQSNVNAMVQHLMDERTTMRRSVKHLPVQVMPEDKHPHLFDAHTRTLKQQDLVAEQTSVNGLVDYLVAKRNTVHRNIKATTTHTHPAHTSEDLPNLLDTETPSNSGRKLLTTASGAAAAFMPRPATIKTPDLKLEFGESSTPNLLATEGRKLQSSTDTLLDSEILPSGEMATTADVADNSVSDELLEGPQRSLSEDSTPADATTGCAPCDPKATLKASFVRRMLSGDDAKALGATTARHHHKSSFASSTTEQRGRDNALTMAFGAMGLFSGAAQPTALQGC